MEIAILRFDGLEITDTFTGLINPERPIQEYVSRLTGIRQSMLKSAPRFHEVARRIVEITEGAVIVAHNASFDYRILRTEFDRLGYDFKRQSLCTVALSQRLIPDAESHSLGKLARSLGIAVSDRHRAHGDALATLKLLKILLLKEGSAQAIKELIRGEDVGELSDNQLKIVNSLPERTGVYSMFDKQGNLLYISASGNLRQSVNQHFTARDKLNRRLQKYAKRVEHELSGTLLLAELQAKSEQLVSRPKYVPKKKARSSDFKALHRIEDEAGYQGFLVGDREHWEEAELLFPSYQKLEEFLVHICGEHRLCTQKSGLSSPAVPCPVHRDDPDHGQGKIPEAVEAYNARLGEFLERFSLREKTLLIQENGRISGEKGFIFVRNGRIAGMGYSDLNLQTSSPERIEKIMRPLPHDLHNRVLVESILRERNSLKTHYF